MTRLVVFTKYFPVFLLLPDIFWNLLKKMVWSGEQRSSSLIKENFNKLILCAFAP